MRAPCHDVAQAWRLASQRRRPCRFLTLARRGPPSGPAELAQACWGQGDPGEGLKQCRLQFCN
eukprot:15474301-Alexandrium_andersonii.AAC.1